ncbi:hypothetical protein FB451DRAFT_47589 [Mycena latifolia]|nr:hypothetical protein FB451DRAFT_47589 [Mycena latifolia]
MAQYSLVLAWDEGDEEAAGPGDAEFLSVLTPNCHISLLKHIQIARPQTHLQGAKNDIREMVRHIAPFQVLISTDLWPSGAAICLTVATHSLATPKATPLEDLRSDILKIFDRPYKSAYSVAEAEKRRYKPHITVRRDCESNSIPHTLKTCSDVIRNHVGPFREQLALLIRGINMFQDTAAGPRFVEHFPFGGSRRCLW